MIVANYTGLFGCLVVVKIRVTPFDKVSHRTGVALNLRRLMSS